MSITFSGDPLETTDRIVTGWASFDYAFGDAAGNVGWPGRSIAEVYGPKSIGKTALSLSVLGVTATARHKNLTILDLEIQDRGSIEQILKGCGFDGEIHYIMNKDGETPEDTLGRFTDRMFEKNPDMALVDSLGAYYPNATLEGSIGDRNVGQKAFEIGQFTARLIRSLQIVEPKKAHTILMTNHQHPTFGSMIAGNETSGGVTKKFLSHIRIDLKRFFWNKSVIHFGTSWLVKGRVDNNRFGYSLREFQVFMVGGEGIHKGLTAMWDCIIGGYAELSSKKPTDSTTVSMDGQSFGKLGTILRDRNTEPEIFVPFINKLKEQTYNSAAEDDDDSDTESESKTSSRKTNKKSSKRKEKK